MFAMSALALGFLFEVAIFAIFAKNDPFSADRFINKNEKTVRKNK